MRSAIPPRGNFVSFSKVTPLPLHGQITNIFELKNQRDDHGGGDNCRCDICLWNICPSFRAKTILGPISFFSKRTNGFQQIWVRSANKKNYLEQNVRLSLNHAVNKNYLLCWNLAKKYQFGPSREPGQSLKLSKPCIGPCRPARGLKVIYGLFRWPCIVQCWSWTFRESSLLSIDIFIVVFFKSKRKITTRLR